MKNFLIKNKKIIGIILLIILLILIYIVSPKITNIIKNIAQFLYEIDENYITRAVELILSATFLLMIILEKGDDNNEIM